MGFMLLTALTAFLWNPISRAQRMFVHACTRIHERKTELSISELSNVVNSLKKELSFVRSDVAIIKSELVRMKRRKSTTRTLGKPSSLAVHEEDGPLDLREKIFSLHSTLRKLSKLKVVPYVDLDSILDAILDMSTLEAQKFRSHVREVEPRAQVCSFFIQAREEFLLDPHEYAVNLHKQFENSVMQAIRLITEKLDALKATGSDMLPIISTVRIISVLEFQRHWVEGIERGPFGPCFQPTT